MNLTESEVFSWRPSTIIFAPTTNAPLRRDVTGAFLPEAQKFASLKGGTIFQIDNRKNLKSRASQVSESIRHFAKKGPIDNFVFFCHGTTKGIQLGFNLENVDDLAKIVAETGSKTPTIILYCCSVAAPKGFAERLRDELVELGVSPKIVGHTTKGHTTKNPHVRVFESDPYIGGVDVVTPGSSLWKIWRDALKTDYRFDFPFKDRLVIQREILTGTRD